MPSLFIEELDGITGVTQEEAAWREAMEAEMAADQGPVWSNYGGWVA